MVLVDLMTSAGEAVGAKNRLTRTLCACVLTDENDARQFVLNWLRPSSRAVVTEFGIDVELVLMVALRGERKEAFYRHVYLVIALLAVAIAVIARSTSVLMVVGVAVCVASAAAWYKREVDERASLELLTEERFDRAVVAEQLGVPLDAAQRELVPAPDHNLFVYTGFTPFVGQGHDLGGWSVAIALDKSKHVGVTRGSLSDFHPSELYEAFDEGVRRLCLEPLQVLDCYFAHGRDIREERTLLPNTVGRPVQKLAGPAAERYTHGHDPCVRHYRCYRAFDWRDEVVFSYFTRCRRHGDTLYVEARRYLMPPIAEHHCFVDELPAQARATRVLLAVAGLIYGPLYVAAAPFASLARLAAAAVEAVRPARRVHEKRVSETPRFDYGAHTSLRSAFASPGFHRYFQKIDGDFYSKVFEREILDTLVEFLDTRGIDTFDLRERQTSIQNEGVIIQRGDFNAQNVAVGAKARVTTRSVPRFSRATQSSHEATLGQK